MLLLTKVKDYNYFWYYVIALILIPFTNIYQFVSYGLFVLLIYKFKNLFPIRHFLFFILFQFCYSATLKIFYPSDIFLLSFFLGVFTSFSILIFFINYDKLILNRFDCFKGLKILEYFLFVYSILLLFQMFMHNWIPEEFIGVHGRNKGHHLNAQIYYLASGFYLFKKSYKKGLYFLFIATLGSYNLGLIIFISSMAISGFFNFFSKKAKKQLLVVLLFLIGFLYYSINISESSNYLLSSADKISKAPENVYKIQYFKKFFNNFFSKESPVIVLLGTSLGNGGSRSALFLTGSYFSVQLPGNITVTPQFVKTYVSQYINIRGTANKPFSSLIAILSEFGILGSIIFFIFIYQKQKKIRTKLNDKIVFDYLLSFMGLFFILTHILDLLPIMVMFLYLYVLTIKQGYKQLPDTHVVV